MQIQTIFTSMLAIREEQGRPPYGLCYEFECTSEFLFNINYNSDYVWTDFIQDQFPQWYSGDKQYPIADPYHECPAYAYHANEGHEMAAYQYRRRNILKQLIIDYNLFYMQGNLLRYSPRKRSSNVERYLPHREYVL